MAQKITQAEAIELMNNAGGKIFTVTFIKKNGETRTMNCRRGVQKYVTGVGMRYDPAEHNLFVVFDMQKDAHRIINLETMLELKISGKQFQISEGK